jgi:hypothetical protein
LKLAREGIDTLCRALDDTVGVEALHRRRESQISSLSDLLYAK